MLRQCLTYDAIRIRVSKRGLEMSLMKRAIGLFVIASAATSTPLSADPVPGQHRPKEGGYQTDWGSATFDHDNGNRIYGQVGGRFHFADGHIIWGYFEKVPDDGPHAWSFIGRWVAVPDGSGMVPRTIQRANKCRTPMSNLPSSIDVPDSLYWGSIRINFGSSGTHFSGNIDYCRNQAPPNGPYSEPEIRGSFEPVTYSATPAVPVPSFPYDGPCSAVSRTAVAAIEYCRILLFVPMRMRLLQDMPKAVDRVIFTPLSDDHEAVVRAVRNNTVLPIHPSGREVYQVVRDLKFWKRGDTTEVIPPGSVCRHDLWVVSVRDGTGTIHRNNGVVYMDCGPGSLLPKINGFDEVRGLSRPAQ
jgi:hypothetical protein